MAENGLIPVADAAHIKVDRDLVQVRVRGLMTLRDLNHVIETYRRVYTEYGYYLVLYDATKSDGIDRAARKALTETHSKDAQPISTAIFGASFAIRTLANMIDRAMVGLGRRSTGIKFFSTEAQALDHLGEQRRQFLATR